MEPTENPTWTTDTRSDGYERRTYPDFTMIRTTGEPEAWVVYPPGRDEGDERLCVGSVTRRGEGWAGHRYGEDIGDFPDRESTARELLRRFTERL